MVEEIELDILSSKRLCVVTFYGESFATEVSHAKRM